MSDDSQPVLEALVFAAALALAVGLGYYGLSRWRAQRTQSPAAAPADYPSSGVIGRDVSSEPASPSPLTARDMAPTTPPVRATIPRKKRRPAEVP